MKDDIEQKIRERAYEIYEYRRDHGLGVTADRLGNLREITAQDDWLESESEILEKLKNDSS